MELNAFGYYWLASSLVAFMALLRVPSRTDHFDNVGGSAVAALVIGWLVWPAIIFAALKSAPSGSNT